MMMQEHLIVPSEAGTNPAGSTSSPITNPNRVALNVSFTSMTATVGSPPPPHHGHLQGGGNGHQHPNIPHHVHHSADGPNSDNRYGLYGEKIDSFQGIGPGIGSVGGAASASSDASSSSSGGGGTLWPSHGPSVPPIQNHHQHQITHLPNENDDLKMSQNAGINQRCGRSNSASANSGSGQLNGHQQHPDLLPPGYIEHHQKQLELAAAASGAGDANSPPSASSPGGGSSCGGVMGVTSLLSSPPDIINNSSVGTAGNAAQQNKKTSSRRNAWGNLSYADLITQAIKNSPDQRLTLSQVYEWMVANIPYFKDKGDSNSSAGWKNSIRHNLSLHSRFVRVQNEGTGKSSWWMMNPDVKAGSGKNSRRRAPSVDAAGNGQGGGSGGPGGVNGRGPDFKRRGRTKKNNMGVGGLIPSHIRNGGPQGNRIGNDSIPSPGVATGLVVAAGGPGGLYDLNPESPGGGPGMLHPHQQYPFADIRGHPSVGPSEFSIPIGGRISPTSAMRLGAEGGSLAGFNYPGQEWPPTDYPACGPMPGYFPGSMSRPYGDPLGSDPSNSDYPGPRPMSPLHPYPNRSINGFPYRGGSIVPNGNTGPAAASLFSSPHHHNEPTPYNHHPTSQLFSGNINGGSHENKLPNSPSNTNIPLEGNRPNPGQHSYSNLQSVSSPNGQTNRPISFPSPSIDHHPSQNTISTTSSSSSSAEGSVQIVGNHMSPIDQRNANGEAYFSQQAGAEDNGNDPSLCRLGQKSNDGNNLTPGAADDNSNQQGSILEKALAKQDQDLLTSSQATPLTNTASLDWTSPTNGENQHIGQSGRVSGYTSGGSDVRDFMMKQEMDSPSIEYMQHYHPHHPGHHPTPNGPNHDHSHLSTVAHHQVYANNATLHIPGGGTEDHHHLIRHHSTPSITSGADQYHSNSKHPQPPPWVR